MSEKQLWVNRNKNLQEEQDAAMIKARNPEFYKINAEINELHNTQKHEITSQIFFGNIEDLEKLGVVSSAPKTPEQEAYFKELTGALEAALADEKIISKRHRKILEAKIVFNKDLFSIADDFGLKSTTVRDIIDESLTRIKASGYLRKFQPITKGARQLKI